MIVDKTLEANSSVILYRCKYTGIDQKVLYEELFYSQYVIPSKDIARLEDMILCDCDSSVVDVCIEILYRFPSATYIGSVWKEVGLSD